MLRLNFQGKSLLLALVLSILFVPSFTFACDTSPVLSAANVQSVGGGNYTVDIQVCNGINGSIDGFDLAMGCGLNILSTTPTTLTNGANTATSSIAGNTVTYTCGGCNASNWFVPDINVAGPCFNFTLTVDGNPENCPFTVTGVNDGCLLIAFSWSANIPGPCIPAATMNAPGTQPGNTTSSGNTCNLRTSNDQVIEVNLPCSDLWTFDLCGSASWDTYLYLGTSCCSSNLGQNDDACGLQSSITATAGPGLVYVTIEAFGSGSGAYGLQVTGGTGCPLEFAGVDMQASPDLSNNAIDVLWTVEDEEDVSGYFLERSEAGGAYVTMEQFAPEALPNGRSTYNFQDRQVKEGVPYSYRLHVHTISGLMYETEPVNALLSGTQGMQAGRFYPNPASEVVTLDLQNEVEGRVQARIYDAMGRVVQERALAVHAGNSTLNFDIANLSAGTYFVRFVNSAQVSLMRKFVVE